MAESVLGLDDLALAETGNRQCSNPANALPGLSLPMEHSSWLVIAGLRELCGVAVPVTSGVVDPVDGGPGSDPEEVGEDGGR